MAIPRKQTWQERCVEIHAFHASQLKLRCTWSVRDTARALNRSHGGISEDLQLAEFLRTYEYLKKIDKYTDALAWIKEKKRELRQR